MKKLLASSILLAACSFPLTTLAGTDSGLYIGGSVGQSSVDVGSFDEEDTAYKVFLGYNFGVLPLLDLGVEADYRDFGTFKSGEASLDMVAYDIYGVAGLTFGPFGLFGKVGYTNSDADFHFGGDSDSDSESATTYGIGAKFQIGSLALRAEYETFDLDDLDDLSMISVGAVFTF